MPFYKEKHSMAYILSKNIVFIAGGSEEAFYYDINFKEFIIWGKMNGIQEKPALIEIEDYLYSINSFNNQEGFYFERTKLKNPSKIWEKILPQCADQESSFFYNQLFGVSKCSSGHILFAGGINNQFRTFIYNIKSNMIIINSGKDECVLLNERNYYKIDHNFNIGIPTNIEKDHMIALLNKNSKTLNLRALEETGFNERKNIFQYDIIGNRLPGTISIECKYMNNLEYENDLKQKKTQQNNKKLNKNERFGLYNTTEERQKLDKYKLNTSSLEKIIEGSDEENDKNDEIGKRKGSDKKIKTAMDLRLNLDNFDKFKFSSKKKEDKINENENNNIEKKINNIKVEKENNENIIKENNENIIKEKNENIKVEKEKNYNIKAQKEGNENVEIQKEKNGNITLQNENNENIISQKEKNGNIIFQNEKNENIEIQKEKNENNLSKNEKNINIEIQNEKNENIKVQKEKNNNINIDNVNNRFTNNNNKLNMKIDSYQNEIIKCEESKKNDNEYNFIIETNEEEIQKYKENKKNNNYNDTTSLESSELSFFKKIRNVKNYSSTIIDYDKENNNDKIHNKEKIIIKKEEKIEELKEEQLEEENEIMKDNVYNLEKKEKDNIEKEGKGINYKKINANVIQKEEGKKNETKTIQVSLYDEFLKNYNLASIKKGNNSNSKVNIKKNIQKNKKKVNDTTKNPRNSKYNKKIKKSDMNNANIRFNTNIFNDEYIKEKNQMKVFINKSLNENKNNFKNIISIQDNDINCVNNQIIENNLNFEKKNY